MMFACKQRPIGILDSGVGGLLIARAVRARLPNESIVYFGDTAHVPYGEKHGAFIRERVRYAVEILQQQHCKCILIACNSAASAMAAEEYGTSVPWLDVITPIVAHIQQANHQHIGLLGTQYTVQSGVYAQRIAAVRPDVALHSLAAPQLVPLIESGQAENPIMATVLHDYLKNPSLVSISSLILGCTHYEILRPQVEAFYGQRIAVLHTPQIITEAVVQYLSVRGLCTEPGSTRPRSDRFWVSRDAPYFSHLTRLFFGQEAQLYDKLATSSFD